jgi:hypothetical protein
MTGSVSCYNVTTTYVSTETESGYTSVIGQTVGTITGTTVEGTTGTVTIPGGTYGCFSYAGTTYYLTESGYTINGTTYTIPGGYTESQNATTVVTTVTETYETSNP